MAMYKDMTPDERAKAHADQCEAITIHADGFAARPPNPRSRLDRKAMADMDRAKREAGFIFRVAKSCGDSWATT